MCDKHHELPCLSNGRVDPLYCRVKVLFAEQARWTWTQIPASCNIFQIENCMLVSSHVSLFEIFSLQTWHCQVDTCVRCFFWNPVGQYALELVLKGDFFGKTSNWRRIPPEESSTSQLRTHHCRPGNQALASSSLRMIMIWWQARSHLANWFIRKSSSIFGSPAGAKSCRYWFLRLLQVGRPQVKSNRCRPRIVGPMNPPAVRARPSTWLNDLSAQNAKNLGWRLSRSIKYTTE